MSDPPLPPMPALPPLEDNVSPLDQEDAAHADPPADVPPDDHPPDEVDPVDGDGALLDVEGVPGRRAAEAWGEPELFSFDVEGVQEMANALDHRDKRTSLNDKRSLWNALEVGVIGMGISLRGKNFKIPTNVVAADSWNGAFTNALNFAMSSLLEQEDERIRFNASSNAEKKRWRKRVNKLHKQRPPPPLGNGRPAPEPVEPAPVTNPPNNSVATSHRVTRATTRANATMEEAARERASDENAIQRSRDTAGYSEDVAIAHRGRASELEDREQLMGEQMRSEQSYRKENTPPTSIGQQNDRNTRRMVNGAMRKVAKCITGIHLDEQNSHDGDGDEPDRPIHSMVLILLNEVIDQHNDQGGALVNSAAETPKLTILGLNVETINHIMSVVSE